MLRWIMTALLLLALAAGAWLLLDSGSGGNGGAGGNGNSPPAALNSFEQNAAHAAVVDRGFDHGFAHADFDDEQTPNPGASHVGWWAWGGGLLVVGIVMVGIIWTSIALFEFVFHLAARFFGRLGPYLIGSTPASAPGAITYAITCLTLGHSGAQAVAGGGLTTLLRGAITNKRWPT